jgi:hypothetical protein
MAFAGIMIVPFIYYIIMAIWLPRNMLERAQFLFGLLVFTVCGPIINIAVLLFAVYNMDSFGWGKTRLVMAEEEKGSVSLCDGQAPPPRKEKMSYDEEAQIGSRPIAHGRVANWEPQTSSVI